MSNDNRIGYIDICKGIAIFFVVLGHTYQGDDIRTFIYAFHLPVFYFIAGCFYIPEKNQMSKIFFMKKVKTILLPYFTFYLLSYIYWILLERHFRPPVESGNVLFPLIGLFYGTDSIYMIPNGALWFLPSLFISEMALHFIAKYIHNRSLVFLVICLSAIIGFIFPKLNLPRLPFSLNSSLIALFFLGIGFLSRRFIHFFVNVDLSIKIFLAFSCFILVYYVSAFNGRIDIDYTDYHNPLLFIIAALLGILGVLLLGQLINKSPVIQYLGVNSLIIFAFHQPIKRIVMVIISKVMDSSVDMVRYSVLYSFVCVISTIALLIPVIYLFNNYLFMLIGKRKRFIQS